jgi:ring-1,2-phenylacetyl-CoA epoxidase subunit PaaD
MVAMTEKAWAAASAVSDPELPPLTIADLGVLRGVHTDASGRVVIRITPTYTGCPAMTVIQMEIETALDKAGVKDARVETELAPAWSSADITAEGRTKLAQIGIAPPPDPGALIECPRCKSTATEELSRFGATACKSLWRCTSCLEPFEAFKAL